MNNRDLLCGAVLAAAVALAGGSAQAAPGGLDPTFGAGGKVTTAIVPGDTAIAYAVALQPDGKIVAAGQTVDGADADFALARYTPNASLDPTFGTGGKVKTPIGTSTDFAKAIALQPDGKLVAAGTSLGGGTYDFVLARYNPNGSLDTSFGFGGKVRTSITSGNDFGEAIALQSDGKIVVAGATQSVGTGDVALARYNPNGSLDTSFGTNGIVTTAIGTLRDGAAAVTLQPDGKIVAAGFSSSVGDTDVALVRYDPSGSLDASFGSQGKVRTPIGGNTDVADAVALQPDGKIVAAGYSTDGATSDFSLVRYNPNGSLDATFGTAGKVITQVEAGAAQAVALQPDGRIVAAGYSSNGVDDDFTIVRYQANGSLDPAFGTGGKVLTPIGTGDDLASAIALQPEGRIVAVGSSKTGNLNTFALVRYLGSTLTVAKTGSGSGTVTSPAGIDCGSTCSTSLAAVPVTLTATASSGSTFRGWTGDCSGTGPCVLTMSADRSATATFDLIRCVPPKLRGKKLTAAKRRIRAAHCAVGKVKRAFSSRIKKGKVISQTPRPGSSRPVGAKVKLKVSKGKRRKGTR